MSEAIKMAFPLRGEWHTPNTPGSQIPSHGSHKFGTTYAYDFVQLDWNKIGKPAYRGGLIKYLTKGIAVEDYYCWGQEIYSPCDGIVVQTEGNYPENERTNLRQDLNKARQNAHHFHPAKDKPQQVAGNFVIMDCGNSIFAALCHLQKDSLLVKVGQKIQKGQAIGRVGHSGNSFAPHLHFQLMNSSDLTIAKGLPCAFEQYEVYKNGEWHLVKNGIPTKEDRIRFLFQ